MKIFQTSVAASVLAVAMVSTCLADITALYVYIPISTPRQTGSVAENMLYELGGGASQYTWFPATMTFAIGFTATCSWSQAPYNRETARSQGYPGAAYTGGYNAMQLNVSGEWPIPWSISTPRGTCGWWCTQQFRGTVTEETSSLLPGLVGSAISLSPGNQTRTEANTVAVELCRTSQGGGSCQP